MTDGLTARGTTDNRRVNGLSNLYIHLVSPIMFSIYSSVLHFACFHQDIFATKLHGLHDVISLGELIVYDVIPLPDKGLFEVITLQDVGFIKSYIFLMKG